MPVSDILGGIGGMAGGIAGLFEDDKASKTYAEIADLWRKLRTPNFDMAELSPRELQLVGEYMPEVYQFIAPEGVQLAEVGPAGRQSQLDALGYFDRVRQEGLPLADKLAAENATNAISQQTARDAQYAQEALRRRGMGTGGSGIAAQIAAGQASSDLARQMGQDLSQNAIYNRMNAAASGADIGSQMRSQDFQEAARNAEMWNRFNEFVSTGMTQAAADAANARNQAQMYNLGTRQNISDTNINNKNAYDVMNRNYRFDAQQQDFENQGYKTAGLSNALAQQGNYQSAQHAARVNNLTNLGQSAGQTVGGVADLLAALGGGAAVPAEDEYSKLIRQSRGY